MGRRLIRRIGHVVVALVPLPLIGLGYAYIFPGGHFAYQLDHWLGSTGSAHALKTATAPEKPLARQAASLFDTSGKGPRADQYLVVKTTTYIGRRTIAAFLGGPPSVTSALTRGVVIRARKADRLTRRVTEIALRGSVDEGANTALLMASLTSSWPEDAGPSPLLTAYSPSEKALGFKYKGETQAEFEARERRCLSVAIYFEARGEPVRGQTAVGQVILNRVRSPLFPETICGVVFQGQMHKGCQFSFTCDGHTDNPKKGSQWELAQDLSRKITSRQAWLPEVGYSTFYHANYVKPRWVRAMSRIDSIGRHIFYKKRNETPYIVEASATETTEASVPTVSLASTAGVSLSSTPVMSLGFAASE